MEIRDRGALRAAAASGEALEYLFFWGHAAREGVLGKECLSQWYLGAPFEEGGARYLTAEHYMMAGKARLFGDEAALEKILASTDPGHAKKLGREVRGFTQEGWEAARFAVVARGNELKFGQHEALRAFLLSTGDKVLVEASPRDTIWGIGMGAENPDARDPARWRGHNLLGFALMEARARLRR
jgi:ribA/ribD-fused uncharacterized protein